MDTRPIELSVLRAQAGRQITVQNDKAAIGEGEDPRHRVSVEKPAVDPTRRISTLKADRAEISTVPVYSKPA